MLLFNFIDISFFSEHSEMLLYAIIPIVSAVVGWGTNVLALKMTFYPIEFVGIKPFLGWQGIVPMKAGDMAEKAVDLLTNKLLKVEDQFEKISPERVSEEMAPVLIRLSEQIINEAMEEHVPKMWETVPKLIKNNIYRKISEDIPLTVTDLMEDIKSNINDLFDVKGMVVNELVQDKSLLNDIFLKCGAEEFKFIERSGLYFGFLFGILQMLVWIIYPASWILPVAGLLVGWATNVLALKLIFEPKEPKKIGPWTIQGLFIKRQKAVAAEYAKIVSERILTSPKIVNTMISGPTSDRMMGIVQMHVKRAVDETAGLSKSFFQLTQGTDKYIAVKAKVADRLIEEMPFTVRHVFGYAEEALDMENTLREKMSALPPDEFEGVLRPAYQQDEWKLILTGAILGGLAGLWQLLYLFS